MPRINEAGHRNQELRKPQEVGKPRGGGAEQEQGHAAARKLPVQPGEGDWPKRDWQQWLNVCCGNVWWMFLIQAYHSDHIWTAPPASCERISFRSPNARAPSYEPSFLSQCPPACSHLRLTRCWTSALTFRRPRMPRAPLKNQNLGTVAVPPQPRWARSVRRGRDARVSRRRLRPGQLRSSVGGGLEGRIASESASWRGQLLRGQNTAVYKHNNEWLGFKMENHSSTGRRAG